MSKQKQSKKPPSNRRLLWWVLLTLLVLILGGLIWSNATKSSRMEGPQFRKEGTLQFVRADGQPIRQIDIEIADTDMERARGLMWRRTLGSDQGMLFIMETLEPQSFWMLNTYLSLDILFVDADSTIVKIRPNTKPRSLDAVTSDVPALYVVEVNAGFCAQHGIREGDQIRFTKN